MDGPTHAARRWDHRRGGFGALMVLLALGAVTVGLYLGLTKLMGGVPVCGPLRGCETVDASPYSLFLGIPVGLLGAGASLLMTAAALAWWLRADVRGLYLAYALGLVSLPVLAWLTYLELFVIGAICIWCVTYAVLVIAGWLAATAALVARRPAGPGESGSGRS
jgi:uncharacterized membrane protein